jgi:hypothetical protein
MTPIFTFGDEVRVTRAIRNDGTMPGYTRGQLLVRRGSTGFVREWGVFLQDQIIYQIHFLDGDIVVGCRAQELIPAGQPWMPGCCNSAILSPPYSPFGQWRGGSQRRRNGSNRSYRSGA